MRIGKLKLHENFNCNTCFIGKLVIKSHKLSDMANTIQLLELLHGYFQTKLDVKSM